MGDTFNLFADGDFNDVCQERRRNIYDEIKQSAPDFLLNANEDDLVEYYLNKLRFDPIEIYLDQKWASGREGMIPAEWFPSNFNVSHGYRYAKHVVTFHVPYSGDKELARLRTNSHSGYLVRVSIGDGTLDFDVVNFYDDAEKLQQAAISLFKKVEDLCRGAKSEVEYWNREVEQGVRSALQQRKAEHLKRANMMAALGVPLKKASNVPETFAVPVIKKKIVAQRPIPPTTSFAPEPTLPDSDYEYVLKLLNDVGVAMESHPSTYQDKREESLRDHFIMSLTPHFDSVTGETFHKEGKTDIFIRHEGKNIFVAECKYWDGKVEYLKTIDQLFQYVTWRDTKAAVILFVATQELTSVLDTIGAETRNHSCFVRDKGKRSDGWFQYEFHLPGDSNRHVKVAVLVFHFPAIKRPRRANVPRKSK